MQTVKGTTIHDGTMWTAPIDPLKGPIVETSALLRSAILAQHPDPVPRALLGREEDGTPMRQQHIAFCVADGTAKVWVPAESDLPELPAALDRISKLGRARCGPWSVQQPDRSAEWETITPASPGRLKPNPPTDAARLTRVASALIKTLPPVVSMTIAETDEPARRSGLSRTSEGERRVARRAWHARFVLAEPVQGPVFAGFQHHFGLGWCRAAGSR